MILKHQELQEIVHGAYAYKEIDGYVSFMRFNNKQLNYLEFKKFFHDRARFSSSVTLEFVTEAEHMKFSYKIFEVGSYDSLDVYINDKPARIQLLKEFPAEGEMLFQLGKGSKKVVVYLPIDMVFTIKDFCLDGEYHPIPKRQTKVLWLGDSITQGYGAMYTSYSYVNRVNRYLQYEIINQGIGGYYYDYKSLQDLPDFNPDKIIVALGINCHKNPDNKTMIKEYYERLVSIYPNISILTITPLWTGGENMDIQSLEDMTQFIKENAEKYPQMKVIDGFLLVPHLQEYFLNDVVHPNTLGMITYADNLMNEIKRMGF